MFRWIFNWIIGALDWFSGLLTRPGQWMERLFVRTLRSTDVLSNDRWFNRLILWLFEPFRWVINLLDRFSGISFSTGKEGVVKDDEESLKKKLKRNQQLEQLQQSIQRSWLSRVGQILLFPFIAVLTLSYLLLRTRTGGRVILPLMILAVGAGATVYAIGSVNRSRLAAEYQSQINKALEEEDYELAQLFSRKLEQLGYSTDASRFNTALSLEKKEDYSGAYAMMLSIAPEDEMGFPLAHLWLAGHLIQNRPNLATSVAFRKARKHLSHVPKDKRYATNLHFFTGIVEMQFGNDEVAKRELAEVADEIPDAAYFLLELQINSGDPGAEKTARIVKRFVEAIPDGQELRALEVNAQVHQLMTLESMEAANRFLDDYYSRKRDIPMVTRRLARSRIHLAGYWVDGTRSEGNPEGFVKGLEESIGMLEPEDQSELTNLLVKYWRKRGDKQIDLIIEKFLDDENPQAPILVFAGNVEGTLGHWEKMIELLERAIQLGTDDAVAYNNLAHAYSRVYPDKIQQGQVYAEKAGELAPADPSIRETRGYIRFKLGQYDQAASDLEYAIHGLGERPELIRMLIESLEKSGRESEASRWKKLLQLRGE